MYKAYNENTEMQCCHIQCGNHIYKERQVLLYEGETSITK